MELGQILSWVMVALGLMGFYFIGKHKWWGWYVNLACQALWFVYGWTTGQYAFVVSAIIYATIFAFNAGKWTANHLYVKRMLKRDASGPMAIPKDGMIIHNAKLDGSAAYSQLDIELIARVCHEANRVLQLANDEENYSYPWHTASEDQKHSAIEGVKKALEGASAHELHDAWCRQKHEDGWVYGETKDEANKTHPCLVPYYKLPEEQRIKDHMFKNIVKAFKIDYQEKESLAYVSQ